MRTALIKNNTPRYESISKHFSSSSDNSPNRTDVPPNSPATPFITRNSQKTKKQLNSNNATHDTLINNQNTARCNFCIII